MPEGLQQGETLEPLNGFPPPSMPDAAGASHPSLREGETLEPIGQPTYPDTGDSSQIGRDTGFVHGLIRGGRNIVHAAKEFGSDIANPDMPVALSDRPGDQGSVAAGGPSASGNPRFSSSLPTRRNCHTPRDLAGNSAQSEIPALSRFPSSLTA